MDNPRSENEGPYVPRNRLKRYPGSRDRRAQQEDAPLQESEGAWVSAGFQQRVPADVNDSGKQDENNGVYGQDEPLSEWESWPGPVTGASV